MRDLFIAFAYQDEAYASGFAESLTSRGLTIDPAISLWPQMRLLQRIDQGLRSARHGLVVVSRDFLKTFGGRSDLDALTTRAGVVSILYGIEEGDVARYSTKLAVASYPGEMAEVLVRLFRSDSSGGTNGRSPHP